jgi:hypothetical protein
MTTNIIWGITYILKHYKYRILLMSLLLFLLLIRINPWTIIPLIEEWETFKFALGIVIIVSMVVSYGIHTKSTTLHGILCLVVLLFTTNQHQNPWFDYLMWAIVILFFARITRAIINTLLREKHIWSDLLIGCIAGYMMIAISGFLLFSMLDNYLWLKWFYVNEILGNGHIFTILYYSFITLMTIGYGDIVPVMPSMQLVTILYSLVGRAYSTFVLAMVLKKFNSEQF